jgi:hypothetical protein
MSKNTKKPILAENTVRRFMKLASIETLSDGFVNETYKMEEEEMNEMSDYNEGMHDPKEGMHDPKEGMRSKMEEQEEEMDDEAPTDEAAEEVTISDDEAEALIDAHNAADEVVAKLEDAMAGEEPEAEEDEEAEEEGEPPMDADLMEPEEEAGDEEPMMEDEEVMEELYEAALSGLNIDIEKKSKEELVNEVKKAIFQRVVRRLIKESKSK